MAVSTRHVPIKANRIHRYFQKNQQIKDRVEFEKNLFLLWGSSVQRINHEEKSTAKYSLPREKLPTKEFKNFYFEKVVEQAWNEYKIVCDFFARDAVVVRQSKTTLSIEEFPEFKDKLITSYPRVEFPIQLLSYSASKKLITEDKTLLREMNFSGFLMSPKKLVSLVGYGSLLLVMISISDAEQAIQLIEMGLDINQCSTRYGNTPLLLAITKGWNHVMTETTEESKKVNKQQRIIRRLLEKPELDIHATHIFNGMTALHIACLRGDDPEFIYLLLSKGARIDATDYLGKTPLDMLQVDFLSAQKLIECLSSDGEYNFSTSPESEHCSFVATLPPRKNFVKNKQAISNIFTQGEKKQSAKLNIAENLPLFPFSQPAASEERKADEKEQKSNSSCCIWLKILAGAALFCGGFILLILLASPLLKVVAVTTMFAGGGLFYHGYHQYRETKEVNSMSLVPVKL